MLGVDVGAGNRNKGLKWTALGKPQVFPGLQYPGLQDLGLHPVERASRALWLCIGS